MAKKNEKKMCWNCDGYFTQHAEHCPYCGVDASKKIEEENPFSRSRPPDSFKMDAFDENYPAPPYAGVKSFSVSDNEWNQALENQEKEEPEEDEMDALAKANKNEMIALLLLLPGIVFLLFALALFFFSHEGVLTLQWNQNFAYFYFIGAIPLIILGWKSLR